MKLSCNLSLPCFLISLLFVLIIGCRSSTPPVSFYTLTPMPGEYIQKESQDISIGIGPVRLPKTLERPHIVTRTGPNRLHVSEFHRWGGYLDQDFQNVTAENISILLKTDQVAKFPWKDNVQPTYRISFDVHQFDGMPGDSVILNVTWTIRKHESSEAPYIKRSIIKQSVSGEDYEALVAAYSHVLAELSKEIADVIQDR